MDNTEQTKIDDNQEKITFKNVEFTQREKEIFCNLIRRHPADTLPEFIFSVLGDKALLFFELFQDENIKIPSFEELKNNIIDSKILAFFEKESTLDDDPYGALARWTGGTRRNAINRINEIKKRLGEYNVLSYEKAVEWDKGRKRFFRERKRQENKMIEQQKELENQQLQLFNKQEKEQ